MGNIKTSKLCQFFLWQIVKMQFNDIIREAERHSTYAD